MHPCTYTGFEPNADLNNDKDDADFSDGAADKDTDEDGLRVNVKKDKRPSKGSNRGGGREGDRRDRRCSSPSRANPREGRVEKLSRRLRSSHLKEGHTSTEGDNSRGDRPDE